MVIDIVPTPGFLPKRRDLPARAVAAEVLVRDSAGGMVHFLNPTAAVVWECCDGVTSAAECEERLRAGFLLPDDTDLLADIGQAVEDFRRSGLLCEPGCDD